MKQMVRDGRRQENDEKYGRAIAKTCSAPKRPQNRLQAPIYRAFAFLSAIPR
jgi:hypothetical protein